MLTETDIARIAGRVAAAYRPVAMGIFDSYATGTATGRSDLDLVVIRKPGSAFPADTFAVRRLSFDVLHPIDVQVFDPAEFEESAYEYQSFTWVIARQARLYHWDSEAERTVPSLVTRAAASQLSGPGSQTITDHPGRSLRAIVM